MVSSKLDSALDYYEALLKPLEADEVISEAQVLEILLARDEVQRALSNCDDHASQDALFRLIELDQFLKKQVKRISCADQIDHWCSSLVRSDNHWWWSSKNFKPPSTNTLNTPVGLVLGLLTFSALIPALALTVDISSRFILGGPGVIGTGAVVFQSFLALIASRGTLTGADGITTKLVNASGIPEKWQQFIKFGLVVLFLAAAMLFHRLLPAIAGIYYQNGEKDYRQGQLASAENNFSRAISLDPNNLAAHNNLGELYEDLQKFEDARTKYQIAMQGGLVAGYNNLARYYILQHDKEQKDEESNFVAIRLLKRAESLLNEQEADLPEERYKVYTHLGWAYFELGDAAISENYDSERGRSHLDQAQSYLQAAIELEPKFVADPISDAPATAHCLLAQVLESWPLKDDQLAKQENQLAQEWEKCLSLKYRRIPRPYELRWYVMAQNTIEESSSGDQ